MPGTQPEGGILGVYRDAIPTAATAALLINCLDGIKVKIHQVQTVILW